MRVDSRNDGERPPAALKTFSIGSPKPALTSSPRADRGEAVRANDHYDRARPAGADRAEPPRRDEPFATVGDPTYMVSKLRTSP